MPRSAPVTQPQVAVLPFQHSLMWGCWVPQEEVQLTEKVPVDLPSPQTWPLTVLPAKPHLKCCGRPCSACCCLPCSCCSILAVPRLQTTIQPWPAPLTMSPTSGAGRSRQCFSHACHFPVITYLLLVQALLERTISDKADQHAKEMQRQKSLMERKDANLHDVQHRLSALEATLEMERGEHKELQATLSSQADVMERQKQVRLPAAGPPLPRLQARCSQVTRPACGQESLKCMIWVSARSCCCQ